MRRYPRLRFCFLKTTSDHFSLALAVEGIFGTFSFEREIYIFSLQFFLEGREEER